MASKIEKINNEKYTVSGKIVYKNNNDDWIATVEMSTEEVSDFQQFISEEENPQN